MNKRPIMYYVQCSECHKKFAGFTQHQADHQLNVHRLAKHGGKDAKTI